MKCYIILFSQQFRKNSFSFSSGKMLNHMNSHRWRKVEWIYLEMNAKKLKNKNNLDGARCLTDISLPWELMEGFQKVFGFQFKKYVFFFF